MKDPIERQAAIQPEQQHGRVFKGVVVEYPPYNIWKPYFSIKYTENGQEFIGYGTYKPEVLSEYLKEYFMPSAQPPHSGRRVYQAGYEEGYAAAQPERKKGRWLPDNNSVYEMRFVCSECKESQVVPTIGFTKYKPIWDFCPYCGARMEGEEQE